MKKNNLIRFVQSLLMLPVMTMPVVFMGIHDLEITQNVLAQKFNIVPKISATEQALIDKEVALQKIRAEKAKSIDDYFEVRDMPLAGMGMKMVEEAEKNDLDWRLLPAISVRESTGGKFACKNKNNPFGWGSCKIGFDSTEKAIEVVAKNIGGNHPKTEKYYANKNVKQILRTYNPPSVVPRYAEQVIAIMNAIGKEDELTGFDLLVMANK